MANSFIKEGETLITLDQRNTEVSIIIPVFDEELSLRLLFEKIKKILELNNISMYEVIFIDDGSSDNSWKIIHQICDENKMLVHGIRFRKNIGKSAALNTGFRVAKGDVIITMDADLQDDPDEIPHMINELNKGFHMVSGWKRIRHDPGEKVIASKFFNFVTKRISGVHIHDFNCGFKVYRKEVVKKLKIYGELHRYIPVLVNNLGFRVGEIQVKHHSRQYGKSKYGVERYFKGFMDLLTILVITKFFYRPNHLFSGLGLFFGSVGTISLTYLFFLWLIGDRPIGDRPLLLFGIMSVLLSVQLVSIGILSEIFLRTNYDDKEVDYICEEY